MKVMASIKDLKRMCVSYDECGKCPLFDIGGTSCRQPYECPDNTDEIVDEWVSEHPVKTYAMDFFEKFPGAQRNATTGIPIPCIRVIYSEFYDKVCPAERCSECWNREMKEDE